MAQLRWVAQSKTKMQLRKQTLRQRCGLASSIDCQLRTTAKFQFVKPAWMHALLCLILFYSFGGDRQQGSSRWRESGPLVRYHGGRRCQASWARHDGGMRRPVSFDSSKRGMAAHHKYPETELKKHTHKLTRPCGRASSMVPSRDYAGILLERTRA